MRYRSGHIILSLLASAWLGIGSLHAQKDEDKLKAQEYFYEGISAKNRGDKASAFALLDYSYKLWSDNADIAFALGELYAERGNYNQALDLFKKAYSYDPSRREFFEALVSTYSWGKNQAEATNLLESWLKDNPEDEEVTQYLARTYLGSGDFDRAIALYDRLQKRDSAFARYARIAEIKATLYEAAKQKDKADAELRSLVDRYPDEPVAKVSLVEWYYKHEQFAEALPILERLKQTGYSPAALRPLEVEYYIGIKNFSQAEVLLREHLEDMQVSAEDKAMRWYQFVVKAQKDESIPQAYNSAFTRLIELHPDEPVSRHTYAQVLRLQKDYAQAIEVISPLRVVTPEEPEVWNSLIGDAISLEDNDRVLSFSLEAINHVQGDWRYYFYASIGLFTSDKSKQAIDVLKQGLSALPESEKQGRSHLYAQLGDIYTELGDRKESFACYEEAIKYDPDNASVLNNYAYALAEKGEELEKADSMAARAVKLDGNNINNLDTYAWICFRRGNYTLAHLYQSKALDQAEQEKSVTGILLEHMGDIVEAQGDRTQAISYWERAISSYTEELKNSPTDEAKSKTDQRLKALKKRLETSTKRK